MTKREPWPTTGPDHNKWNTNLSGLIHHLDNAKDMAWWGMDTDLKYLNIRIDTRDNSFVIQDRNNGNKRFDPNRILDAIERYRVKYE